MSTNVEEHDAYSSLQDLNLKIIDNDRVDSDFNGGFFVGFWVYLPKDSSSPVPSAIVLQQNSDTSAITPFLELNENNEIVLYPINFVPQEEASVPIPTARTKIDIHFDKWIHIGCEVSTDIVRLHINGENVGETHVTCSFDSLKNVSLMGANENDSIEGYVHNVEILPITSSIDNLFNNALFVKDPPGQLHVDGSSAIDIEEDSDGVWSVVGGKASCRRNFSLDVVLLDAFGYSLNKEMEIVATLIYADNGANVEKTDDLEAPLLTNYDGIEFASCDKPSKLINGRASFKLKISQLSSKCDNKLFRIKFNIHKTATNYPFFEAFSRSIRCISRNRNTRPSTLIWKRSTSAMHAVNGASWLDGGSMDHVVHEAKPSPPSKRVKLGQVNPFVNLKSDNLLQHVDEERNEGDKLKGRTLKERQEMRENMDTSSSDSDSSEATNSCKSIANNENPISDLIIFKYCLGTLIEKSTLLKDFANSASERDLNEFATRVSQFSGCPHHRNQIRISKRMIEEGTKIWNLLSQNNYHVLWENMILVLRDQFTKISCCRNRFLTQQDFDVLRRISGSHELVTQENFEKLWCWLYPVAFALSQNALFEMWDSKWIEGFVTKEEAELSLQAPAGGLVDPGTFVLRFPTSRSWPHSDSGNLVVTYVGSDFVVHHRLLSLDFFHSSSGNEMSGKTLKEMLLEERELSRLGRITTRTSRY